MIFIRISNKYIVINNKQKKYWIYYKRKLILLWINKNKNVKNVNNIKNAKNVCSVVMESIIIHMDMDQLYHIWKCLYLLKLKALTIVK